jgi:DNA-binding response OmpR family regulator
VARYQDHHAHRARARRERERGLKVGADAYVTKPFSTRDLVEQAKRMLGVGG